MALEIGGLRRVRALKRADDSDSQDAQDDSAPEDHENNTPRKASIPEEDSVTSGSGSNSDDASISSGEESGESSEQEEPDAKALISSISFGDLASAQASLGTSRKRKRGSQEEPTAPSPPRSRSSSPFHEAEERQAGKSKPHPHPQSRSSKHAPTEMSSKKAVSRRRTVISAPKVEARDPRFSNLSGGLNANKVAQKYAFLNEYRADEMRQLKDQIRTAKDGAVKERLKRELRVMEDRERARKKVEDEKAVIREHRKKESEAVRQGKKPFYLKKADIKKQVLVKQFEGLGEKKVEKVMERRRRKKAMKEKKSMPRNRRMPV